MPTLQPLRIFNFGGLSTTKHPQQIGDNESPDLLNVAIRDGTIRTRPGTSEEGSSSGTDANLGLFEYRKENGDLFYVRCQGGSIQYKTPSGAWTTLKTSLSTSAKWAAAVANDYIYLMNGVDTPQRWNGTDASTTAVATVKNGNACAWKYDRLIVEEGSKMWFSDEGNPESFPGTNWFWCGKQDGGVIQQILAGPLSVVLLKDTGRFQWHGGVNSWQGPQRVSDYGSLGPNGACVLPSGDIWYIGRHGIRKARETGDELMSGKIAGTLKNLAWTHSDDFAAAYFDNYVIFAAAASGAGYPDHWLLFDLIRGEWTWWDLKAATLLPTVDGDKKPVLLFGNSAGNSKTYKLGDQDGAESTFNDDGAAINAYYATKPFDLQRPDKLKRWKKLFYSFIQQETDYYVTLSTNENDSGWVNHLVPIGPQADLQYDEGHLYDTGLQYQDAAKKEGILKEMRTGWCRTLQLKVSHNTANQPFHLLALAPHYKIKRSIR